MAMLRNRLARVEEKMHQAKILDPLVVLVTTEEDKRRARAEHGPDRMLIFMQNLHHLPPGYRLEDYPGYYPAITGEEEEEPMEQASVEKPARAESTGKRKIKTIKAKIRRPKSKKQ